MIIKVHLAIIINNFIVFENNGWFSRFHLSNNNYYVYCIMKLYAKWSNSTMNKFVIMKHHKSQDSFSI